MEPVAAARRAIQALSQPRLQEIWAKIKPAESADPNNTWKKLSALLPHAKLEPPTSAEKPKAQGAVRIVAVSDTHNLTHDFPPGFVPDGDILVHGGDFTSTGTPKQVDHFVAWLKEQPHKHKIVIAGNHEVTFDVDNYPARAKIFHNGVQFDALATKAKLEGVCTYLEDASCVVEGITFYGSPWQPEFFDWGFNLPRGEPCLQRWRDIPDDVDVLITHGPSLGYSDRCDNADSAGCVDLLREIQLRVQPQLHIFGHIHEAYGVSTDGRTVFANASTCNLSYEPEQRPFVFDIFPPGRAPASEASS